MRLAAIDLGSNAIRLLISDAEMLEKNPIFIKLNLVRVPLRLGMDVFNGGVISKIKEEQLLNTLHAYNYLMKAYGVEEFRAAASSAMRDATNGPAVAKKALKDTGIDLRIISGKEEAQLLLLNQDKTKNDNIFIDVGGGSTEITIKKGNKIVTQESFNLGTLRILHSSDTLNEWNRLEKFLKKSSAESLELVGTGGNINKTFSLLKIKEGKPITKRQLDKFYNQMAKLSVSQRIEQYNIREDRADVIVPALSIYRFVMEHLGSEQIYVPKLGLADGMVKQMFYDRLKANPEK